jgi:hypothetical protein
VFVGSGGLLEAAGGHTPNGQARSRPRFSSLVVPGEIHQKLSSDVFPLALVAFPVTFALFHIFFLRLTQTA